MYKQEIDAPKYTLQIGSSGFDVMRVQGWLCLRGCNVVIDSDFGPATDKALRAADVGYDGKVTPAVWEQLAAPLIQCAAEPAISKDFGETVVYFANTYLRRHSVEAGGDNRGPWVRHFCRGFEVAWCQGFVSSVWDQAAEALGISSPIPLTLQKEWCLYVPRMVDEARRAHLYQDGRSFDPSLGEVPPGSMMFVRGGMHGYSHVGIVMHDDGQVIETIEGNTNDEGSANGYEVCRRFRKRVSCDYGRSMPFATREKIEVPPERVIDHVKLAKGVEEIARAARAKYTIANGVSPS